MRGAGLSSECKRAHRMGCTGCGLRGDVHIAGLCIQRIVISFSVVTRNEDEGMGLALKCTRKRNKLQSRGAAVSTMSVNRVVCRRPAHSVIHNRCGPSKMHISPCTRFLGTLSRFCFSVPLFYFFFLHCCSHHCPRRRCRLVVRRLVSQTAEICRLISLFGVSCGQQLGPCHLPA